MKPEASATSKEPQRPKQAAALISEGLNPARIAKRWGVTEATVIQYIHIAVGKGLIRQCDVLFSLDKKWREHAERLLKTKPALQAEELRRLLAPILGGGCSLAEMELYLTYRKQKVYIGTLYDLLAGLECELHTKIRQVLKQHFGEKWTEWWRDGIPQAVRVACSERWERDANPASDPFYYTMLIDLSEIMAENWGLFKPYLHAEYADNKGILKKDFRRLNEIRNRVMHPIRSDPPTEEDFEFVRAMHRRFCPRG